MIGDGDILILSEKGSRKQNLVIKLNKDMLSSTPHVARQFTRISNKVRLKLNIVEKMLLRPSDISKRIN